MTIQEAFDFMVVVGCICASICMIYGVIVLGKIVWKYIRRY